jgi:hypothetical protein
MGFLRSGQGKGLPRDTNNSISHGVFFDIGIEFH